MEANNQLHRVTLTKRDNSIKRLLNYKSIVVSLQILTIFSLFLFWQPWEQGENTITRKITVTGTATIATEPDQFLFSPTYSIEKTSDATSLNNVVIKKLKSLGVREDQIKNNASTYGSPEVYYFTPVDGKQKTVLSLNVTVRDRQLAQKVQDYLLSTNPQGALTPYPTISKAKQKQLLDTVRDAAIKDAREKAKNTAQGLDAKVGKVLEITEGTSPPFCFGASGACPVVKMDSSVSASASPQETMSIQPGTDNLTFSVTITYSLR